MKELRGVLYAIGLVAIALLIAAMVTSRDRSVLLPAQWGLILIGIAMLVDIAIRGDDDGKP